MEVGVECWAAVARQRIGRDSVVLESVIDLFADRQSSDAAGDFDSEAMFSELKNALLPEPR